MNKMFLLFLNLILLSSCQDTPKITQASGSNPDYRSEINRIASRYESLGRFSGTIFIQDGSLEVYQNSFGYADYEQEIPFTDSTAFKVGSLSELYTAAILHRLQKTGRLNIGEEVKKYIPELSDSYSIEDLMEHPRTLASITETKERFPDESYDPVKFAQLSAKTEVASSALEYNLLGVLIERASKKSFEENLEDLSSDLNLENTYFQKKDTVNQAKGYLFHNYRGNGLELELAPEYDLEEAYSSTGIKSTVSDLQKILLQLPDHELQKEGYLQQDGFSYGILKNSDRVVIILSNRRHPVAGELLTSIESVLENQPYVLPLPRTTITVASELMKEYAGIYELGPNGELHVQHEADSLYLVMGPQRMVLHPQSENQFFLEQNDSAIRFLRDSTGFVSHAELLDGFLTGQRISKKKMDSVMSR